MPQCSIKKLLADITPIRVIQPSEFMLNHLTAHSAKVQKEQAFVALCGTTTDGHKYIPMAVEQGAKLIVCQNLPESLSPEVMYVLVEDSQKVFAQMSANFFDRPSEQLQVVGITGTNGKTSTATMLFELFTKLGYSCGLVSTVVNRICSQEFTSTHTTPDAFELQSLFATMLQQGCTHCFMEVSSHALVQHRTFAVRFAGAVFTNISHDHLDYHQTFQAYIQAKKMLFDQLDKQAFALVNADDKRAEIMLQNCPAQCKERFALFSPVDYQAKILSNTFEGLALRINQFEVWLRIVGQFNAYNALAVFAVAQNLGIEPQATLEALSTIHAVKGRFEIHRSLSGVKAVVDYAHTPDALENVLQTAQQSAQTNERLLVVVGCGGDRDKTKRPLMAKIAAKYADVLLLTSDNPRTESPQQIIDDMLAGLDFQSRKNAKVILDRRQAIKEACLLATSGDIVLIAGKGHENYQEIQGQKFPFDDTEEVKKALLFKPNYN